MNCVVSKNVAVAPLINTYTQNIMILAFLMFTRSEEFINDKVCS